MDYTIQRSQRKKITLIIERDDSIIIRVPNQASDDEVGSFVKRKKIRIYKKLAEKKFMQITDTKKQYVGGEGFLYLGRRYKLHIVDEQQVPLRFYNNAFYIIRSQIDRAEELFIQWYIIAATGKIEQRLEYYQKRLGRTAQRGGVKDLQYRRGSCTANDRLYFHRKVILAPLDVIDYIVAHELIHVVEKKHTKKFWDMMALVMPEYEKHKEWLKRNGGNLTL